MTPPPESHEKRQRNRRKQQKRKEKLERRLQRKAEKRYTRGPVFHTLFRGTEQYRIETDLWLGVLNLAAVGGWTPPVAEPPAEPSSSAYARPAGLKIEAVDANILARSIESVLPTISEEELPLENHPFGEEHTESLLARRLEGERLDIEDAHAAHELLSGPGPRAEVARLASFLKEEGQISIEAS